MNTPHTDDPGHTAYAANALCQKCDLCCDGSLFPVVIINRDDLEDVGLEIHERDDGVLYFHQPCSKFSDGVCSIYASRPKTCRNYSCKLQKKILNGSMSSQDAESIFSSLKLQGEGLDE
jgi:Fe-S-cluster containining protein